MTKTERVGENDQEELSLLRSHQRGNSRPSSFLFCQDFRPGQPLEEAAALSRMHKQTDDKNRGNSRILRKTGLLRLPFPSSPFSTFPSLSLFSLSTLLSLSLFPFSTLTFSLPLFHTFQLSFPFPSSPVPLSYLFPSSPFPFSFLFPFLHSKHFLSSYLAPLPSPLSSCATRPSPRNREQSRTSKEIELAGAVSIVSRDGWRRRDNEERKKS